MAERSAARDRKCPAHERRPGTDPRTGRRLAMRGRAGNPLPCRCVERFTPVALDAMRELDRPLAVVFDRKTAELNTRARRFAVRLSRAFEISGGVGSRRP